MTAQTSVCATLARTEWLDALDNRSAGMLLERYLASVTSQAPLVLTDRLEPLNARFNGYLDSARQNACHYRDEVQPRVLDSLADLSAYGRSLKSLRSVLQGQGKGVQRRLIAEHAEQLSAFSGRASAMLARFAGVRDGLASDMRNFAAGAQAAAVHEGADRVQLAGLSSRLASLEHQLSAQSTDVLSACLRGSAHGFWVGLGNVLQGHHSPMTVGGAFIIGGLKAAASYVKEKRTLFAEKRGLLSSQASLSHSLVMLETISVYFRQAYNDYVGMQWAIQSLNNGWQFVCEPLGQLVRELEKGSGDSQARMAWFLGNIESSLSDVFDAAGVFHQQWACVDAHTYACPERPVEDVLAQASETLIAARVM